MRLILKLPLHSCSMKAPRNTIRWVLNLVLSCCFQFLALPLNPSSSIIPRLTVSCQGQKEAHGTIRSLASVS
ncbi:rCG63449 [Rattus norvegicus]|uniref:RCG63449 n=1 Tax=Rattus norvegicus TaxID=10116 RepID=A6HBN1_RAT|nr:rCG63449 [Rattus norvegicus]